MRQAIELGRPVQLAVRNDQIISSGLDDQLGGHLGNYGNPMAMKIHDPGHQVNYIELCSQSRVAGLLTNAESKLPWRCSISKARGSFPSATGCARSTC